MLTAVMSNHWPALRPPDGAPFGSLPARSAKCAPTPPARKRALRRHHGQKRTDCNPAIIVIPGRSVDVETERRFSFPSRPRATRRGQTTDRDATRNEYYCFVWPCESDSRPNKRNGFEGDGQRSVGGSEAAHSRRVPGLKGPREHLVSPTEKCTPADDPDAAPSNASRGRFRV